MSQLTRKEVVAKLQRHYQRAGAEYKSKLITQAVELFGYHRKAAIRALGRRPVLKPAAPFILGRPKEYDPEKLLTVLKPIWLGALQPCGKRLVAALPDWVAGYEQDHRRGVIAGSVAGSDRRGARPRDERDAEEIGSNELFGEPVDGGSDTHHNNRFSLSLSISMPNADALKTV